MATDTAVWIHKAGRLHLYPGKGWLTACGRSVENASVVFAEMRNDFALTAKCEECFP